MVEELQRLLGSAVVAERRRHEHVPVGIVGIELDAFLKCLERPAKLLRAFDKVTLAPGETKRVPLSVEAKDLAWFNPDANAWEVEPMTYGVLVGPSSRNQDLLKTTFTLE